MVEVKNLVKRYGKITAVDNISFSLNKGEVLGFLGPNGAGKTTTMNIISGYISATSGTVTINGYDIVDDALKAKAHIGYLPELPPVYMDMTVAEYLSFIYDLKKVKIDKAEHMEEVMKLTGISGVSKRIIRNLSKGYRQRVGVAQALIGNPDVIILDEPTVGLDPRQIIEMRNLIRALSKKHAVILSSHVLSEVSAVCDRIIVISKGKITADEPTENLAYIGSQTKSMRLLVKGNSATVISSLNGIDGVTRVRRSDRVNDQLCYFVLDYKKDEDVRERVFRTLSKADCPILEMTDAELSLEEIFLKLTDTKEQGKGGVK